MRANDRLLALVEVALGGTRRETLGPISAGESVRIAQLSRLAGRLEIPVWNAPEDLIVQAVAIAPPSPRPRFRALLASGPATARLRPVDLRQALFEFPGGSVRLTWEREPQGWLIRGHVNPAECEIERPEGTVLPDSFGRFAFRATSLEESGFQVIGREFEVDVPSIVEANRGGS